MGIEIADTLVWYARKRQKQGKGKGKREIVKNNYRGILVIQKDCIVEADAGITGL